MRRKDVLQSHAELALQQPRLRLLERLAREPRLLPYLDAVARDEQREHRDRLRLGEAAPDAAARAPREGQEAVARVVLEEAPGLEGVGVFPVLGCEERRGGKRGWLERNHHREWKAEVW